MELNLSNHPCFNNKARHHSARIHLPVAPRCNIQCKFCNRDFECVNESRPGITAKVLEPFQALAHLEQMLEKNPAISVVGIAGPGDPFANPSETLETMHLVREKYPNMLLCVATNGLNLLPYVDELAELKVSHVTITINAVRPELIQDVYAWMRYDKRVRPAAEAAEHFIATQLEAIKALKAHGIIVKINSILIPGVNENHIPEIAKTVADLGADIFNVMGLIPAQGSVFENMTKPSPQAVNAIRKEAEEFLPQMSHCSRCRADAVGFIGQANTDDAVKSLQDCAGLREGVTLKPVTQSERKYIAVATMEGVLINQHLGEAERLYIYEHVDGSIQLKEVRETPRPGSGDARWERLAETLHDCRAIAVSGIGGNPRQALENSGIEVLVLEGMIEQAVAGLFEGSDINYMIKRSKTVCGESCQGTGGGCG